MTSNLSRKESTPVFTTHRTYLDQSTFLALHGLARGRQNRQRRPLPSHCPFYVLIWEAKGVGALLWPTRIDKISRMNGWNVVICKKCELTVLRMTRMTDSTAPRFSVPSLTCWWCVGVGRAW